jgi:hypothetical protein
LRSGVRKIQSVRDTAFEYGEMVGSLLQARLIELNLPINVAIGTRD